MIPNIDQLMRCYAIVSASQRAKTGKPSERTVQNVISGTKAICKAAGIELKDSVWCLNRQNIDNALGVLVKKGKSRTTAWSYFFHVQSLFAKWTKPYYIDAEWEVPEIETPCFRRKLPRYERPSAEMLRRVKAWYLSLQNNHATQDQRDKLFVATMMLEFAVRNGDVLRLDASNFAERDGQHFLSYTPHKTELTSGRRVFWPIHPDIWNFLESYISGDDPQVKHLTNDAFRVMNKELRAIGFRGNKALYELRKICIDHIYQRFGAEIATSISGDDIRTISKYYADPTQPNAGNVRVLDLI